MITGMQSQTSSKTVKVLSWLDQSVHTFHLTGSRKFGNETNESDYDFFADHTPAAEVFLKNIGFDNPSLETYTDSEMVGLWKHREAKIDVQLVRSALMKNKVQEMILAHYGFKLLMMALPKPSRSILWDFAYCLLTGKPIDPRHTEQLSSLSMPGKMVRHLTWKATERV